MLILNIEDDGAEIHCYFIQSIIERSRINHRRFYPLPAVVPVLRKNGKARENLDLASIEPQACIDDRRCCSMRSGQIKGNVVHSGCADGVNVVVPLVVPILFSLLYSGDEH